MAETFLKDLQKETNNKVSPKIENIKRVEQKIVDIYAKNNEDLIGLEVAMKNNFKDENLQSLLEKSLTMDHVKKVLNQAASRLEGAKEVTDGTDPVSFDKAFADLAANHLSLEPADEYERVEPDHATGNYAVQKKGETSTEKVTLDAVKTDIKAGTDACHVSLSLAAGYDRVKDPTGVTDGSGNYATKQPGRDPEKHMAVYESMGAGLIFNLQIALAKLGCHFTDGIDGMYGDDTIARVKEFQKAWNTANPTDLIKEDGQAGIETIKRVLSALDNSDRKPENIVATTKKTEKKETKDTKKTEADKKNDEQDEKPEVVTEAMVKADPEKYHYHVVKNDATGEDEYQPEDGYEAVDENDDANFALIATADKEKKATEKKEKKETKQEKKVEKKTKEEKKDEKKETKEVKKELVSRADALNDMEKYHISLKAADGYEWVDAASQDNYAVKKTGDTATNFPAVSLNDVINDTDHKLQLVVAVDQGYDWVDENDHNNYATQEKKETKNTVPQLSEKDAMDNMAGNNLIFAIAEADFDTYEFVEPNNNDNYAVRKKGTTDAVPAVTLDEIKKDRKAHHIAIAPRPGYEFIEPDNNDNYAVKVKEATTPAPKPDPEKTEDKNTAELPDGYTAVEKANAPADLQAAYDKLLTVLGCKNIMSKDGEYYAIDGENNEVRIYLSNENVDMEEWIIKLSENGDRIFSGVYAKGADGKYTEGVKDKSSIYYYKNGNIYYGAIEGGKITTDDTAEVTIGEQKSTTNWKAGKLMSVTVGNKQYIVGKKDVGKEVDLSKVATWSEVFADNTPAEIETIEKAMKEQKEKIAGLPAVYEKAAAEMQAIFDDTKKSPMDKYEEIESKVQEVLDTDLLPAADSAFAKIREQALQGAVNSLKKDFTFVEGKTSEAEINVNFQKLLSYKWTLYNQLHQEMTSALQPYIQHYMKQAFAGTGIKTDSFKLSDLYETSSGSIEAHFTSYGRETVIDVRKKIVQELGITFTDMGETMRMANLINKIKGEYKPIDAKHAKFILSPTGEIEQENAAGYGKKGVMGWIEQHTPGTDLNILTDYKNFPSLAGKEHDNNKKLLVAYLNAKIAQPYIDSKKK